MERSTHRLSPQSTSRPLPIGLRLLLVFLRVKALSFTPGIEISDVGIDIATVEMRGAETVDVQIHGAEMVRLKKRDEVASEQEHDNFLVGQSCIEW